jgi:HemY protein
MLWSIIKIVVFLALVVMVAFGAAYLLELEGGVRIVIVGLELNLTPLKTAIALGLLILALWLLLKLSALVIAVLKFINGDETAISRYFDRNRQEKGYRALTEGMMALASGEGNVAMARAARAEKYLKKPSVNVRFLNHKFTIMGEVNKVGTYSLLDDRTTLLEAISTAGDLTIYGDRSTVTIVRKNESGSELAKINLLTREVFESPYYYLKNGDVIYVKPTKGKVTFTDQRVQLIPIATGITTTLIVLLSLLIK